MANRRYARGRRARAICQRSGFEIPYRYLIKEPGTGLLVDKRLNDGRWNIVDHPQNFPPAGLQDGAPLRYPTGGTEFPPDVETFSLFEVSLPGGGGILVDVESASVTCVTLYDSGPQASVNQYLYTVENSVTVTLEACYSFLAYNSKQRII